MMTEKNATQILMPLEVDLSHEDVARQLQSMPGGEKLKKAIGPVYAQVDGRWSPKAVLRLFKVIKNTASTITLQCQESKELFRLETGWASTFLTDAKLVVGGAYTIGSELEAAAAEASRSRQYVNSFIIEQIGLALLARTSSCINNVLEEMAASSNWYLGPLLSPGSVHGWELADQMNLCARLPLDSIGIRYHEGGALQPLNSLTFLIGMGPEYDANLVGSPCEVCSRKSQCTFRAANHET